MSMSPAYQPAGQTQAPGQPDVIVSARELFNIDTDLLVPAFSAPEEHVPPFDPDYVFDRETTLALLAGFVHNRRVMVQGRHGTGKSSHVDQVASRLNWPCVRVNLDGHVSRMDLIGKDAIVVRDGQQVTEFQPGMLTWALQRPCALVFDEYDAGRADVMFVIQRVLEVEGRLTLLDQSRVIETFLTNPSADELDVVVQNVSLSELSSTPYKASVSFQKVLYTPGTRHERNRQTHIAQIDFVLRDRVPNEFVRVNPLGLQITYFRVDQAFEEAGR